MFHSSLNWFSIGVPVSARRKLLWTRRTALEACVAWFLIYWASSMIWLAKMISSYRAISRLEFPDHLGIGVGFCCF